MKDISIKLTEKRKEIFIESCKEIISTKTSKDSNNFRVIKANWDEFCISENKNEEEVESRYIELIIGQVFKYSVYECLYYPDSKRLLIYFKKDMNSNVDILNDTICDVKNDYRFRDIIITKNN